MKFKEKQYSNTKEILKFVDHYVNQPIMVSATGVTANADGKKIVPAGSILSAAGAVVNDGTAVGVLFTDVDVTHGDAPGALLIHGFVDGTKLPVSALKQATIDALPMIKFFDVTIAPAS